MFPMKQAINEPLRQNLHGEGVSLLSSPLQ